LDCINPALTAFTSIPTSVYCNPGQTYLMVLELKFGTDNDSVKLFINPSLDRSKANEIKPDAVFCTAAGQTYPLTKYAFVGKSTLSVSIDDVRFGDSFKAVTPIDLNSSTDYFSEIPVRIYNSNGKIRIENNQESADILIYNCLGVLIACQHITETQSLINVPAKGLVFVKFSSKSMQTTKKILL